MTVAGWAFDLLLLTLTLAVAAASLTARSLLAAVLLFVAYGLLLAIAWLRLGAPDVALAEAAIGAGLTGVLLIGALARLTQRARPAGGAPLMATDRRRSGPILAWLSGGLTALLGGALVLVAATLPREQPGLAPAATAALPRAYLENPVNAVLLVFRGYDTLLETGVLLLALIGLWSLAPQSRWGGRPGWLRDGAAGDPTAPFFVRLLAPVGLLTAGYLTWIGGSLPGGAFQGGTVAAATLLMLLLTALARPPATEGFATRLLPALGFLVFLAVGAAVATDGRAFLELPPAAGKWLLYLIEAALALSIAATLALLAMGYPEPDERPAPP